MKKILFKWLCVFLLATPCFVPAQAFFAPDSPTVLITGSNRGLGLEFSRQYAAAGWNVIATCRNPEQAEELKALAKQHKQVAIEKMDVTSDGEVEMLVVKYQNQPSDVLLQWSLKKMRNLA